MSNLNVSIKKNVALKNICIDIDKILTAISDTIKLDYKALGCTTLDITGEMSSSVGIIAVSCEKLQTARRINLIGDITSNNNLFDGTTDIDINTNITNINGIPLMDIFEIYNNNAVALNAKNLTSSIKNKNLNEIFEINENNNLTGYVKNSLLTKKWEYSVKLKLTGNVANSDSINLPVINGGNNEESELVVDTVTYCHIINKTIKSNDWTQLSNYYQCQITDNHIKSNSNIMIIPGLNITKSELSELQDANIIDGGNQQNGKIYLKAYGTVPKNNLPIRIIINSLEQSI